jgi:uncharacterized membrane protein YeiH
VPVTTLTLVLDLCGVFVFALAGALAAVRKRLDVFGVVVIGIITAIGGGLMRDLLLGDVPPPGLRDWRYLAVPTVAAVLVFLFHPQIALLGRWMRLFDAAGLGLFAVTGTSKALAVGLGPVPACLLGVLTGVGGGALRDVLLREIPLVLSDGELYASTALAGAIVVVTAQELDVFGPAVAVGAAGLVFGLRMLAVRRHWAAPTPRTPPDAA